MLYIEIARKPQLGWPQPNCQSQRSPTTLKQESFDESQSMRLAIGHFVDKEPHLDLVTVPR